MKRRALFLVLASSSLILILWFLYFNQTSRRTHNNSKKRQVSRPDDSKVTKKQVTKVIKPNEPRANTKNKGSSLSIQEYQNFCKSQRLKYFSNEEKVMDYIYDEYNDYSYIENQVKFLKYVMLSLVEKKPIKGKVCLLEDYYKRLKTLMNAYKNKNLSNEERKKFVKPILETAIILSSSSYITPLAITRELIDHKLINSSYLYEWKDYMNKLKNNEVNYDLGKITDNVYREEREKIGDEVSFLLLAIERSLQ